MPNPVVHFEIMGGDGAKLQKFYGDLFGWNINADNPMNYGIVDTKTGAGIPGGIGPSMINDSPRVTVYVQVPDLQAALDKATQLGGKTLMPPSEVPGAHISIAMFADPAGNVTGLLKG